MFNPVTTYGFQEEMYRNACTEMRDVLQQEVELKIRKKECRNNLLALTDNKERTQSGIKILRVISKGSIDYKEACKSYGLSEEDCEEFRKNPTEKWMITSY